MLEKRGRRTEAIILLIVAIFCIYRPIAMVAAMTPPVYSETAEVEHYLIFGGYVRCYYAEDINMLFPREIPQKAIEEDSAKYYYCYHNRETPSYGVFAEWTLSETELAEELERIGRNFPDGPLEELQWGEWSCMNFTTNLHADSLSEAGILSKYDYLLFAYHEPTNTVRYIAYDVRSADEVIPYFLSLEW